MKTFENLNNELSRFERRVHAWEPYIDFEEMPIRKTYGDVLAGEYIEMGYRLTVVCEDEWHIYHDIILSFPDSGGLIPLDEWGKDTHAALGKMNTEASKYGVKFTTDDLETVNAALGFLLETIAAVLRNYDVKVDLP